MSRPVTRRTALRGSLAASLGLVAGVASVQAATGAADARLGAIAEELARLRAWADVHAPDATFDPTHPYNATVYRMDDLAEEMDRIDADTFAGVLHKLRAAELPIVGADGHAHNLMCSICSDVTRLHAAGRIAHG